VINVVSGKAMQQGSKACAQMHQRGSEENNVQDRPQAIGFVLTVPRVLHPDICSILPSRVMAHGTQCSLKC
jgi:hypothetical protein